MTITINAYVERLVDHGLQAEAELEALVLEGLTSGEPIEVDAAYRDEKHRRLDERLRRSA